MSFSEFFSSLIKEKSLCERLSEASKPILIYGMGDGAAKLIHALRSKGLTCTDIFASDDFVRGQSFMGYTVKTLSACEILYPDFIVLVAFSSSLEAVISHVNDISRKHELYIPDINVYGDYTEFVDGGFLKEHQEQLRKTYDLLSDKMSKDFFCQLLRFQYSGKPEDLWVLDEIKQDHRCLISYVKSFCDLGAYTGDTILEWYAIHPEMDTVIAFEPESRHFKKLDSLRDRFAKSVFVNAAASSTQGISCFSAGKGRGSSVLSGMIEGFRKKQIKEIATDTLDGIVEKNGISWVDLIKFDVEGMEAEAIKGSLNTIQTYRPALIVSLYHNHRDLFSLPLALHEQCPDSVFLLSRKQKCFPAWEVELTIIQRCVHC